MPSGAAAVVGGSLASGLIGASGASKAADAQSDAAKDAAAVQAESTRLSVEEQRRQFDLIRGDTAPYRGVGANALYELANILGLGSFDASTLASKEAELASLEEELAGIQASATTTVTPQNRTPYNFLSDRQGMLLALRDKNRSIASRFRQRQAPQAPQAPDTSDLQKRIAALRGEIAGLKALEGRAGTGEPAYDVTKSPGYQFRLAEGEKGLQRYQTSRGYRLSGRALKEAQRYSQDYASGEYGNYLDRLYRLAGFGSSGVGTSAAAGTSTAQGISNAMLTGGAAQARALTDAGAARAGGYLGQAQAFSDTAGTLSNYMLFRDMIS